jgi:hypothetical protein
MSEESNTEIVDGWSKRDKTPNLEPSLGNPSANADVNDPSDIPKAVSTVTGDDLIQLFTKQTNLYLTQNVDKWKTSLKSLIWTDITTTEMEKSFRTDTSNGTSPKR